jgi:histidyl-tRNA synthetase
LFKAPRGTADILPQEQAYWSYIRHRASALCQLYGYERIDTPVFEESGLFVRTIGQGTDIVEKEMYTFQDRGGNSMTLRPEGTAPVCRAYLEHGLYNQPQPVKLYYFFSIYRYERPQKGRYREHRQFGCEALGDGDPALDAEIIDLAWQLLQSLGLKGLSLQLNSIGCRACRPPYLEEIRDYYANRKGRLCPDCRSRFDRNPLRLLDCKQLACQAMAEAAPRSIDYLCPECGSHFNQLRKYLGLMGLPYELNHRLVRGLDYYTKTVFEIQPEEEGAQSTLLGGGRYDDLIQELGGKPTPGIGFGTGLERIALNLKKQAVPIPPLSRPQVFIAYIGDEAKDEATRLAAELRRTGTGAIVAPGEKSLKAQLRQANSLGMSQTVIIGEEEMGTGTAILRDMVSGKQERVPRESLAGLLARD